MSAKWLLLSESGLEGIGVCHIACVDIQHILPCGTYPFCRDGDELEYERLDSACRLEAELLGVNLLHDCLVEVMYQRGKKEEGGVLCHE